MDYPDMEIDAEAEEWKLFEHVDRDCGDALLPSRRRRRRRLTGSVAFADGFDREYEAERRACRAVPML